MVTSLVQTNASLDAWKHMLERACDCVLAMGYTANECVIEHCGPTLYDVRKEHTQRRLLKVLGEPCFEVTTHVTAMVDCKFTVTTTPRLIAWPMLRW